jgi:GNAT superfamily N-acetyltransferase
VPLADDPARPGRRVLLDGDGRAVATFHGATRDGRPIADLVEPADGVPLATIADQIVEELGGWKVSGPPPLGHVLIERGAVATRHAHVYSRDLVTDPAPPGWADPPLPRGTTLGPLDRDASELAGLYVAAFPPDHAEWAFTGPPEDYVADLRSVLEEAVAGPRLDAGRLAVDAQGDPAGVVVITSLEAPVPFGGPWVAVLFRRPGDDLRGLGRALLMAATAAVAAAGHPAIGLAVSDGNPAQRLYVSCGFELVLSALTVSMPG